MIETMQISDPTFETHQITQQNPMEVAKQFNKGLHNMTMDDKDAILTRPKPVT